MWHRIEPMSLADVDAVLAIEQQVAVVPWTRGHFTDSLKAGYSAWVSRNENGISGFALWMLSVDEAHLLNIGALAVHHGQGLGFRLLQQVLSGASAAGAKSVFLEVRPGNAAAIRLYHRVGFKQVGRRKGYYPTQGAGREDALVFSLEMNFV